MAIKITDNLKNQILSSNYTPIIIAKIDGLDTLFGNIAIEEYIRIGDPDLYVGNDWKIGGLRNIEDQKSLISLNSGTTTRITQKLDMSRGSSSSISNMVLALLDYNDSMTELVSPGKIFNDVIGRSVTIYSGAKGTAWPQDYNVIFRGTITNIKSSATTVYLYLSNTDEKKRVSLVPKIQDELLNPITNSQTIIELLNASEFILSGDDLKTYVAIEDELIEYTGISGNQLTGAIRGQNNTIAVAHDAEKNVNQVLRLTGNTIDLALKIMLSQGPTYYLENLPVYAYEYLSAFEFEENAIYFKGKDLKKDYGVNVGDMITITGDSIPSNNLVDSIILEMGLIDDGSYIIVADDVVVNIDTEAVVKFKSQFNVLPIGLGMTPDEVDVEEHLRIRDTFLSIAPQDIYFRDILDAKSFLESQIYLPYTCYSVPRKGRSSIVYTVAPLANYEIVTLNLLSVTNPESLQVERSSTENFINQVQYDYDYDPVTEKFKKHKNYPSTIDKTRIPIGAKPLIIQAQGFTTADGADQFTERASDRFLRRYKYGADAIKGIKVMYSVGYQIEIGDVVAVDFTALKLSDFRSGNRVGDIRLMEVTNTIRDEKTGEITIDVLNTTFGTQDRYGLISPSSLTDIGSTTTKLKIKKSFTTKSFQKESQKWSDYIGQNIIVHSEDWTTVYETKILGFDNDDPQGMAIETIAGIPGENWIIQCPPYPDSVDQSEEIFWKQRHAFFSPRISVISGISTTQFTVSALDAAKLFVGSIIRVHNFNFTVDSPEVIVTQIDGVNIYVDNSLGFTPSSLELIDLVGFPDKQQSYRVV